MATIEFFSDEGLNSSIGNVEFFRSLELSADGDYPFRLVDFTNPETDETDETDTFAFSGRAYEQVNGQWGYSLLAPSSVGLSSRSETWTSFYTSFGVKIECKMSNPGGNGGYIRVRQPSFYNDGQWKYYGVSTPQQNYWLSVDIDNVADTSRFPHDIIKGMGFTYGSAVIDGSPYTVVSPVIVYDHHWMEEGQEKVQTVFKTGDHAYFDEKCLTLENQKTPEPYQPKHTTRQGGRGTGTTTRYDDPERLSDSIAQRNSLFSFGSADGNGLTYYVVSDSTLNQVLKFAYGWGLANDNQYLRTALVSACLIPGAISTGGSIPIKVADQTAGVSAPVVNDRITMGESVSISWGSRDGNGDFSDCSVGLSVNLPFVGMINLDPSICFGESATIRIEYGIDSYTGNIVYWIYSTGNTEQSRPMLYGTYTGNCAISVPIVGGGNTGSFLQWVQNRTSSVATGLSSAVNLQSGGSGAIGAAGSYATSLIEIARQNHPQVHIDRGGTVDPSAAAILPYAITLTLTVPTEVVADSFAYDMGLPCNVTFNVGNLLKYAGNHKYGAIVLDNIKSATRAEKEEIKNRLLSGVVV